MSSRDCSQWQCHPVVPAHVFYCQVVGQFGAASVLSNVSFHSPMFPEASLVSPFIKSYLKILLLQAFLHCSSSCPPSSATFSPFCPCRPHVFFYVSKQKRVFPILLLLLLLFPSRKINYADHARHYPLGAELELVTIVKRKFR